MPLPITIMSNANVIEAQPAIASASLIVSATIALHIAQAEALVWAKASKRYTVPITPTPPLLYSICLDLAVYGVLVKQAILANTLEDSPWPDRYKEAAELLEDVATGELPLLNSSGVLITEGVAAYTFGFSSGRYLPTFTELPPEYNEPDPNKLQDLLDER